MLHRVLSGIDAIAAGQNPFGEARLGLISCPTGVTRDLISTVDVLREHCTLVALYSPEHGLRGEIGAGEQVTTYTDARTGLPVHSIYGGDHRPSAEMLAEIDVLLLDVQDVGSRYYTFLSTMMNCMEACAAAGKGFAVLDRYNPIGGVAVEGNLLDWHFRSFVGTAEVPIRHGLTLGEMAGYLNDAYHIGVDLTVVRAANWTRDTLYPETDLQWINPSPNLPNFSGTVLYNGTCLIEGTNLSEGRGTTRPFEMFGAPWLDADRLADALNERRLPGVRFRPVYFTPSCSKHQGAVCAGVQVHVLDARAVRPVALGLHVLEVIKAESGANLQYVNHAGSGGQRYHLDLLAGTDALRAPGFAAEMTIAAWQREAEAFAEKRKAYLLYE